MANQWLIAFLDKVCSVEAMGAFIDTDKRWVTEALTPNALDALGVTKPSRASFPGESEQGIVTRAQILGDIGANHFGYRDRFSQPIIEGSDDEPMGDGEVGERLYV